MATSFPTSLDNLTNPTSSDAMNSATVGHAAQHANANDAIEALQAKVGVNGSAVTTSIDYKLNNTVATKTGTETLTNKTLTSPTINTATIVTPTLTGGTITTSRVDQLEEKWNVSATAATGTVNFDVKTASIWYYTTSASANWTLNFRGDGSTTLSSLLAVGDSITVVFASAIGATQYRPTTFQVDGNAVTPKWQGGTAPTTGNASSTDIYSFTIIKTAATPTYVVFASQTKFGA